MIPTLRAKTKYRLAKYRYTVNLSKDQARIDNYLLKQRFSQRGP